MTLILSTEHHGLIFTISDLAITGTTAMRPVVGRPLDPAPTNPRSGDGLLVALKQKAIRFDDQRLLLWAGDPIVARRVWTVINDSIQHGWPYDLAGVIEFLGLTPEEKAGSHFILHDITEAGLIRQVHMCKEAPVEGQDVWFMGSGDLHFIDLTAPVFPKPEENQTLDFLRPWLTRLGCVFFDEAIDQSNFEYQYGGWFEVAWFDESKLKKVPYLLKLWRADGERVVGLPTFACWYLDDHLCIARVDTPAERDPTISYTGVPDPLERTPLPTVETIIGSFSKPEFQIHIIFNQTGKFAILPAAGGWSQFSFEIKDGHVRWQGGPDLSRILMDRLNGGAEGAIVRPL